MNERTESPPSVRMNDPERVLSALLLITQTLSLKISLENALEAVASAALDLLPADHVSIRVLDHARQELLCGARVGQGTEQAPLAFHWGQGVIGWVVEHGRPARIADCTQDSRFIQSSTQGFQVASILAVPLWAAGQTVGVLSASSPELNTFSDQDELLSVLLANCVAPSIDRARLERIAMLDEQTKALNMRAFHPRLEAEILLAREHQYALTLLMMDLDHFKVVNDTHGHTAGDEVLRTFSNRVREVTRRSDILVRRGGEEFVLIMPQTNESEGAAVAERIRQATADKGIPLASVEIFITVSIGVAHLRLNDTAQSLEDRADSAMYQAKHQGRNRIIRSDIEPSEQ